MAVRIENFDSVWTVIHSRPEARLSADFPLTDIKPRLKCGECGSRETGSTLTTGWASR